MARELNVVGLMNVQMAVQGEDVYVIEANPRASRTVPFVSTCIGVSLANVAARCMAGTSLEAQNTTKELIPPYFSVKESVFPFAKFPGVDPILGPEMKSTGEVMGTGDSFDEAFAKAHAAAGDRLPSIGRAFVSVRDADKVRAGALAQTLIDMGFELVATGGTCDYLQNAGIACERVNKVMEGRPNIVDMIKNDAIAFIVNTTEGRQAITDSATIRRSALNHKVCYTTTLAGGESIVRALKFGNEREVRRLQELHRRVETQ